MRKLRAENRKLSRANNTEGSLDFFAAKIDRPLR